MLSRGKEVALDLRWRTETMADVRVMEIVFVGGPWDGRKRNFLVEPAAPPDVYTYFVAPGGFYRTRSKVGQMEDGTAVLADFESAIMRG